jgi:aldose 1-epimerase
VALERTTVEALPDERWGGEEIVLRDRSRQSWARLRPDHGGNLVGFGASIRGRDVETMLQPTDEAPSSGQEQYGAPVLFPFPNRLREGRARFGGKEIQIDRPPGMPWAIHGLVRRERWRVEEARADADEAVVRVAIDADAATLRQFPFPYRHSLTFRLSGTTLRVDVAATNTGDAPLPIGFGWHPYFRLPLLSDGARGRAVVGVPARRQWALNSTLLPTGEVVDLLPERDFREPRALGETHLDDVYTDVPIRDGESACTLADGATGITLTVAAGRSFREWVVYAPPTRPTICFEPYTCPTDALNLAERGIAAGLIVLRPGETWSDWMELRLTY